METVAGMDPRLALDRVAQYAARVEALGFDALHVPETVNDSFVVAALALSHTEALRVRTAVTVAFARSPMQVALSAWALSRLGGGRFALGLGSQVERNITERYGMEWSSPVERMREYVAAVRACWAAFATGDGLRYAGEHYELSLLQAEFRPDLMDHAPPEVWLGAVGPEMTRLGGAVADGVLTHPTNSHPSHLDTVTLPALDAGANEEGRPRPQLVVGAMVVTGPDEAALAAELDRRRARLAFVLSTPAYGATLARLGHAQLGATLRGLVRAERWSELAAALPQEVVCELCVCAPYGDLPALLAEAFGRDADGVVLRPPPDPSLDGPFAAVLREVALI